MLIILVPSLNKVGYSAESIRYFLLLFFILYPIKDYTFCPIFFSSPNGDCLLHEVLNKSVSPKLSFKCFITLGTQQKFIGLKLISIQIVATVVTLFCLLRMLASIFSFQTNHPHFSKQNLSPNSSRVLYVAASDLTELLELFQNMSHYKKHELSPDVMLVTPLPCWIPKHFLILKPATARSLPAPP